MTGFDAARRAALMEDLLRLLSGRPLELLPFDAVRQGLRLKSTVDRGVGEVPVDAIVGTLGREHELNRAFLPREESLRERWQDVEGLAEGLPGFPAVELYKVGEAYFVVDGHHRVSVARSIGATTIEARVREYLTPVPLDSGASLERVLLDASLAEFLEVTAITPRPDEDFRVTVANGHHRLVDHINGHGYYLGLESSREVPWEEVVRSWRERVFGPMVAAIRASGVMEEFPDRTVTDLYLFTMDHLHFLRERYRPRDVAPAAAVRHFRLVARSRRARRRRAGSWWRRLRGRGTPDATASEEREKADES